MISKFKGRLPGRLTLLLFATVVAFGCQRQDESAVGDTDSGWNGEDWRVEIQLPDVVLPVGMHMARDGSSAWFSNGIERVEVGELTVNDDRYVLRFPAFNNSLELHREGDRLNGTLTLVKRGYEQHMPVTAEPDPGYRFSPDPRADIDLTGRWAVTFTNEDGEETPAIGEFDQQGSLLTGTFLTATGDYRYLAGEVDGRTMKLSTFDGAHAFVFKATADEFGMLVGDFWSGTSWHATWTATRNFDAELPDAYSLTYLRPGYDTIEFTFPNLEGEPVSLDDPRFDGKVVIVTLAGSWCPNCADEAEFLSEYYRENRDRGLEIVTLLFEHVQNFEAAAKLGRELKKKHDIEFELLVAGYSDKAVAAEALPMLNQVVAYPTMIFVDRAGEVRSIHTGFSGPGTGSHYREFVDEFNALMDELLAEAAPENM